MHPVADKMARMATKRKPPGEPMAGGKGIGVSRNRVFRCSDELWDAAKQKAEESGETVADVLRASLVKYVGNKRLKGLDSLD